MPTLKPRRGEGERPVLRFDVKNDLLAQALAKFEGKQPAPVTGAALSVTASVFIDRTSWRAVEGQRTLRAVVNKVFVNAAARLLERARKVSKPTYKTGLFLSAWRVDREPVEDIAFPSRLVLRNPTPYASYVHRAGESRRQTVAKVYIPPEVYAVAGELVQDIDRVKPQIAQAVKALILGR